MTKLTDILSLLIIDNVNSENMDKPNEDTFRDLKILNVNYVNYDYAQRGKVISGQPLKLIKVTCPSISMLHLKDICP